MVIKILTLVMLVFMALSCKDGEKDKITGKWRIAGMHIQYYEQQQEMTDRQIQMMKDSLAANPTDTAKSAKFQQQLTMVQERADQFKASQDTAMQKNRWDFKPNGDFEATETDGKKNGIWSYDDEKEILFTIIDKQTASVHVRWNKDTMILQLDSLNYMSFVKSTD